MAGITPDISTSSFKPLSLQEIMMVPMAKQKMEDELLAETDQFAGMSANVLSKDSEKANSIINQYKSQASTLADEVLNKGVDRSQFHKLRKLKSDIQQEQSQGFLGAALANKKAMSDYVGKMAKKEMMAGWSPREVEAWVQRQAANFQGTDAGDGTFRSFSGSMLNEKVDTQKWINSNLDKIKSELKTQGISTQNIGSFRDLITLKKTDERSFLKIMKTLKMRALGDKSLRNSLIQEAEIYGEDPNDALDFGEEAIKKDKSGKDVSYWKAGKSHFGLEMMGAAVGGKYKNDVSSQHIKENKAAWALHQKGLDKQTALDLTFFQNGELKGITPLKVEEIKETMPKYKDQMDDFLGQMKARKSFLEKENPRISSEDLEKMLDNDFNYQKMKAAYGQADANYSNSKLRLESLYKKVDDKMSPMDKSLIETREMLDEYNGDPIALLEKQFGMQIPKVGEGQKRRGVNERDLAFRILSEKMELPNGLSYGESGFNRVLAQAKSHRDDYMQNVLDAQPEASPFTLIHSSGTGKYSNIYGAWQDKMSQDFDISNASLANGEGSVLNSPELEEVGESKTGYTFKVTPTDGVDDNGNLFMNVLITNNDDKSKSKNVQVINNDQAGLLKDYATYLQGGNAQQAKKGRQISANINYMNPVKKARVWESDKGRVTANFGGKTRSDIYFKKNEYGNFNLYLRNPESKNVKSVPITINGLPGGRTELIGEKEIALALYNSNQSYYKRKAQRQKK